MALNEWSGWAKVGRSLVLPGKTLGAGGGLIRES